MLSARAFLGGGGAVFLVRGRGRHRLGLALSCLPVPLCPLDQPFARRCGFDGIGGGYAGEGPKRSAEQLRNLRLRYRILRFGRDGELATESEVLVFLFAQFFAAALAGGRSVLVPRRPDQSGTLQ